MWQILIIPVKVVYDSPKLSQVVHNRGHGFPKDLKSLQGCTSLPTHDNRLFMPRGSDLFQGGRQRVEGSTLFAANLSMIICEELPAIPVRGTPGVTSDTNPLDPRPYPHTYVASSSTCIKPWRQSRGSWIDVRTLVVNRITISPMHGCTLVLVPYTENSSLQDGSDWTKTTQPVAFLSEPG